MRITRSTIALVTAGVVATAGLTACGSDDENAANEAKKIAEEATSSAAQVEAEAEKAVKDAKDDAEKAMKDAKGDAVKIEYWHRLPDKADMIKVQDSADEWNAANPDIQVKTVKFEGDATASYEKITAAIKAGNGPCLAQASYDGIPAMLVRGELMDVTKEAGEYKANYGSGPFGQVTLGGKTYGLPQDTGPLVYYYDKAAFDELGLKAPETWADYWANAHKAREAGKYTSAFFNDEAGDWFGAVEAANGDSWFAVDGDAWKVGLNSDKSMTVADAWQTSIDAGDTFVGDRWGDPSPTDEALKDGTLIGYIGAGWEAAWNLDALGKDKADWRVAQMPEGQSGPWGGSALVVLKGCEHPKEALKFANWYNTNLDAMVSQGLVPAAKGAVKTDPKVADLYGGQDVMAELAKAADSANPAWLYSPTWPAVKKALIDNAGDGMPLTDNLTASQEVATTSLKGAGLKVAE